MGTNDTDIFDRCKLYHVICFKGYCSLPWQKMVNALAKFCKVPFAEFAKILTNSGDEICRPCQSCRFLENFGKFDHTAASVHKCWKCFTHINKIWSLFFVCEMIFNNSTNILGAEQCNSAQIYYCIYSKTSVI